LFINVASAKRKGNANQSNEQCNVCAEQCNVVEEDGGRVSARSSERGVATHCSDTSRRCQPPNQRTVTPATAAPWHPWPSLLCCGKTAAKDSTLSHSVAPGADVRSAGPPAAPSSAFLDVQRQSKGLAWLKPAGTERAPALVREPQDRFERHVHDARCRSQAEPRFWPGRPRRVTLCRQSG
jgi:hypothetical protein